MKKEYSSPDFEKIILPDVICSSDDAWELSEVGIPAQDGSIPIYKYKPKS